MPVDEYTPTLEEVGEITLSRTLDDVGAVTGTFTAETRPNDTEANLLIEAAVRDIAPEIGSDIPVDLQEKAKNVVALRVAMMIELTLYAQEIRNNLSPYQEYKDLYDEELAKLKGEIAAEEAGEDPQNTVGGNNPAFGFPDADDLWTRLM